MHRTAALLLTLLALTFQLSALADMGLMDRAEACGRVATIYCRAYARCASICPGCEVSTTEKDCVAGELRACSGGDRPARRAVAVADVVRCLDAGNAVRDKAACTALTEGHDRAACGDFYGQANGKDYAPALPGACGPEHHAAGGLCMLTCASDADCRPKYERCDPGSHECAARTR